MVNNLFMRLESWLTKTLKLQIPEANRNTTRILRRTLMKQKLQEDDLKIDIPNDIMNQHIAFLQSELYSIESINSWKGLLDETLIKKYPHIYLRYALWLQNVVQ